MKKISLIFITILLLVLILSALDRFMSSEKFSKAELSRNVFTYMKKEANQKAVFSTATILNDKRTSNACVYFVSEVLRRNNVKISKDTCNTSQIIAALTEKGWKKDRDYKNLEQGDIAFTTNSKGDKNGIPSHTYVFMGWVKEGSYDYAYICDNQAKDYNNKIYHIRNVKEIDTANGIKKDAFSFFMRPS